MVYKQNGVVVTASFHFLDMLPNVISTMKEYHQYGDLVRWWLSLNLECGMMIWNNGMIEWKLE